MRELMYFLRLRQESAAAGRIGPVVIPFFYRLNIGELYHEPRLDRRDKDGNFLYQTHQSRFFERRERGEPEANIEAIRAALMTVHRLSGLIHSMEASDELHMLLEQLCNSVVYVVHEKAQKLGYDDQSSTDGKSEVAKARFRISFPQFSSPVRAVLDFDSTDNDGNPKTAEGLFKKRLLGQASRSPRIVSLQGMGGVGKSTVLQALSVDDHIRQRFHDSIHFITLGRDASPATLSRQLYRVLEESGAGRTDEFPLIQNNIDAALRLFGRWFQNKNCLFLIDDAWTDSVGISVLSRLCHLSDKGGNSVLITTREFEIAALAPSDNIVQLSPREARGLDAQRILYTHDGRRGMYVSMKSVDDSINGILDICDGLPVNLAVAGKTMEMVSMGIKYGSNQHLSELVLYRRKLLRENVDSYGHLFATCAISIGILDKQPREETLGFSSALSFGKTYRRLCVLQKKVVVPMSMLRLLWETESDTKANVIARRFHEYGLANHRLVRCGEDYLPHLSLHASLHDFAVEEAQRNCETKESHDCLLEGYRSLNPEISSKVEGASTSEWWSRKLKTDGYIHGNLCRHLLGAGRTTELVELLLCSEWVRRQAEVNGILYVEADFSLGITALHGGDGVPKDVRRAVKLYKRAIDECEHVDAMCKLAVLYEHGADGISKDVRHAIRLYKRAIREGKHVGAMYNLAVIYEHGADGISKDVWYAIRLYKQAIHEGAHVGAMYNLAVLFDHGANGIISKDVRCAVELYQRAIDEGAGVPAMNALAKILRTGSKGVKKDEKRAAELSLQAKGEELKQSSNVQLKGSVRDAVDVHCDFIGIMKCIAQDQGLHLSDKDLELLQDLKGTEDFPSDDYERQFRTAGICIEVEPDRMIPEIATNEFSFRYGPQRRLVKFVPGRLSALGLSVLSWILLPGMTHLKPFLKVIENVRFENCLVRHLQGKLNRLKACFKQLFNFFRRFLFPNQLLIANEKPNEMLVLPMGWLYWLGISDEFVVEHGKVGDQAVAVSRPPKFKGFVEEFFFKFSQLFSPQEGDANSWRKILADSCSDSGHLLLDTDYRLVHAPHVNEKWEVTGVNAAAAGYGFGVAGRRPTIYDEREKLLSEGFTVRFLSLSHFVGYDLKDRRHGGVISRMKWFKEVLELKNVFPKGENQCFLRVTTGESFRNYPVDMFHDSDCKIRRADLRRYDVQQDRLTDANHIFFVESDKDEEKHAFKGTCSVVWNGSGEFYRMVNLEETEVPIGILFELGRDLGGEYSEDD